MTPSIRPDGREQHSSLTLLGGAAAGAVIAFTFFHAHLVVPAAFYGLFALAGAIYGVFAGLGIRKQIPGFDADRIFSVALLSAIGFAAVAIIAFTLHQARVVNIFLSAFILPPLAAMVCGRIARRMIASAAQMPRKQMSPGWMWGAVVYSPGFIFAGLLVGAIFGVAYSPNLNLFVLIPGAVSGAVGGLISGIVMSERIQSARAHLQARRPEVIAAGAHGSLQVVPDEEMKDKRAVQIDLPLPETPRQRRMVALTALIMLLGSFALYSAFPRLDLGVNISWRQSDPLAEARNRGEWLDGWDWDQPIRAYFALQPVVPGKPPIEAGTWVRIIGRSTPGSQEAQSVGRYIVMTVDDGRLGYADDWQLSPTGAVYEPALAAAGADDFWPFWLRGPTATPVLPRAGAAP